VAYGPASSPAAASAFGVGLRLGWGLRPVTGAPAGSDSLSFFFVTRRLAVFLRPPGAVSPLTGEQLRVIPGCCFWPRRK